MEGYDKVQRFLNLFPSDVKKTGDNICGVAVAMVEADAKRIVPVRTGTLQRSIHSRQLEPMRWWVGSEVHYAGYVEFGTSRMRARPYLRPAWANVEPRLKDAIARLVEELLRKYH
jgi:HK97 gp10 family phage protein